ncbi:hypothetical protein [Aquihabitans sp. McL0605]|uniref:hypothetical protein n=1 Tax=Aquihabitans sp. McL0605 TaxID=3415671 RepID=UPI003CF2928A
MTSSTPTTALDRALDWLVAAQHPSGELPSYASPTTGGPLAWEPDQLNFITALCAEVIDGIDDPRAEGLVDRAVDFLRAEREPADLWRYWARANERSPFTPPDADDTACCSLAVACRGDRTDGNVAVLAATACADGRFHTWLIPHERRLPLAVRWRLRDERRSATQALRAELWANTEAEAGDVDAVVNANVCRYLGPAAPSGAVDWVVSVVEAGWDTADKWHRTPYTLWAAVADGARRGVAPFAGLGPLILDRIAGAVDADGTVGRSLDAALALLAVQRFDGPPDLRRVLADGLVRAQDDDGCWARDIFYYGGPDEVFGWASEALTTAFAAAGLAAEAR